MTNTLPMWLLSISALLLATAALIVALRSSDRSLYKRFAELLTRTSELESALESVQGRVKSLSVRMSLVGRAKPADPELSTPTTDAEKDEWQRRMNLKLALGQIKVR